jgi:hypothetical protein
MHLFECEAVFAADPDAVWKVWTDVAGWPEWDVSKEIAQLDGPFEPGTRGWARQPRRALHHYRGRSGAAVGDRMPGAAGHGHLRAPAGAGSGRVCPGGEES